VSVSVGCVLLRGWCEPVSTSESTERDAVLDALRQGYRLHMDARAGLALQKCLPPELFRLFLATTGQPGTKVTVLSAQLRVLMRRP
jgi:hypothetical protein